MSGASRGLGRFIALELARRGVRLVISSRRAEQIDAVAKALRKDGGDVISVPIDFRNWKFVERGIDIARRHLGSIDLLVNAAATGWNKALEEWSVEEMDLAIDLNLKGTIYMTRAVIEGMQADGRGQIVNIAAGARPGESVCAPFAAAGLGIVGFSRALAREVGPSGITVLTVTTSLPRKDVPDSEAREAAAATTIVDLVERPGEQAEIDVGER